MPRTNSRPDPVIPDHEVLRKIGGGAYGEVWLARGVTGALRAVKVVWREDFDDERGFDREFEGILKFEPISRDHPALVNILHVGRSPDGVSFYYYVMELGDDVRSGQDINPIEYEPRTLRADTRQAPQPAMETSACIDVGVRLAEALDHLHERGLAHRDVKPSNIIFVNGKAKLADIGLVAARDQRTFVGTEGFVPPEGPGSAQADVYSLGKVLYELATGKDRLDFPELPDELPTGAGRKRWLELNRIICDICEPRVSRRKITTANALADALRRLQRGKSRRNSGRAAWVTAWILTSFSVWALWATYKDDPWVREWLSSRTPDRPPPVAPPAVGMLRVVSTPEGADVLDASGTWLGITPTATLSAQVGDEVRFTLRKTGFRPQTVTEVIPPTAVTEPHIIFGELEIFAPPQPGEVWEDHWRRTYQPVDDKHIGSSFITDDLWVLFLADSKRSPDSVEILDFSQDGQPVRVVLAPREEAIAFCDWLGGGAKKAGFLTEDHEALPVFEKSFQHPALSERARREGLRPFRVQVGKIAYGKIELTTSPAGAEVYLNGVAVGSTIGPLTIDKVKPGNAELLVVLEGYKPLTVSMPITADQSHSIVLTLEENQGVIFGRPWEKNGIGMSFVPLGPDLMVSIWETRVKDYEQFISDPATSHRPPRLPDFPQGPDHPVVFVSRDDAVAFCEWLTRREIKEERIASQNFYRLPTDLEWSWMAGLSEQPGPGPGWRDMRKELTFPWGKAWPPPPGSGNFADATAALEPNIPADRTIPGYDDGFAHTAPVGSFPPNQYGLYDLSGNVQEWVADDYSLLDPNRLGVVRGGGWNSYQPENLYTGSRGAVRATFRDRMYGFRVVLDKGRTRRDTPAEAPDPVTEAINDTTPPPLQITPPNDG